MNVDVQEARVHLTIDEFRATPEPLRQARLDWLEEHLPRTWTQEVWIDGDTATVEVLACDRDGEVIFIPGKYVPGGGEGRSVTVTVTFHIRRPFPVAS